MLTLVTSLKKRVSLFLTPQKSAYYAYFSYQAKKAVAILLSPQKSAYLAYFTYSRRISMDKAWYLTFFDFDYVAN